MPFLLDRMNGEYVNGSQKVIRKQGQLFRYGLNKKFSLHKIYLFSLAFFVPYDNGLLMSVGL